MSSIVTFYHANALIYVNLFGVVLAFSDKHDTKNDYFIVFTDILKPNF